MKLETKFDINETVLLPEEILKTTKARIMSIYVTAKGIQYEVRYFWESKPVDVYFYEEELTKCS